ncbi:hypothetical protein ASPCAL07438 [Aspergillus calidoustus]|uniref:DUF7587 domain-containing protein n=1 Tax=Aspergillus calidoustus TaxID=454130 RepID=A0A0U5CAS6_ASPCI|nr:hypothetical protein ASPCAL07438 [Aspergillus calidoustus]
MDRAQVRTFYRCYSNASAGQLRSGRYHYGHPALSKADLLHEFENHRMRENREPTALVSVTSRPLEAMNRALAKYYHFEESPQTIWIIIVRVPVGENDNSPHHAQELALQRQHRDADAFKYEFLFEWEIPRRYVEHRISVKTLVGRGIGGLLGSQYCAMGFPNFRDMQNILLKDILESDTYGSGRWLGSLAHAFGARTCTYELASQLLQNCLSGGRVDESDQIVHFCRSRFSGSLEFSDICDIELGIRDQLESCFGI